MSKLHLIAVIAAAAIGNACASNSTTNNTNTRFEGTWRLVSIDSKPIKHLASEQIPYFTITGTTINGFDGCNSFSGQIDQPGNIGSTRRGCPENAVKLPLDLGDLPSHLQSGSIEKNRLSVPARGQFPASIFERSE